MPDLAGDAILVDNAENLLSVVKKVVEDIQVATIEIKDHRVHERLGLKWVKRDVHTVKKVWTCVCSQEINVFYSY